MRLIQAKCPNCGAEIKVDDTKEAGICEACGTAFITEKVLKSNNVEENVLSKKEETLIKKGVEIIKKEAFFLGEGAETLKKLAEELLDIQVDSYYGKLFSFASGFCFEENDIKYSLIVDLLNEASPKEVKDFAKNIIISHLKINTKTFAETTDKNNIGLKLTNLSSLGSFSTLSLIKILESLKDTFNAEENEVISNAKNGYINFVEMCFEHFEEELSLFYFSETSVGDYNFTNDLCKKLSSLVILEEYAKDIILDSQKIKGIGKNIGEIINANAKIIGSNLIFGKSFLETADKSEIIEFKFNKEDVSLSFKIFSDTVVLGEDKITIGENKYKVEINVADILFINHCCLVPKMYYYDIVYKVNSETITCYRLLCSSADKSSEKMISWYLSKEIKERDDESWGFDIPIKKGLNKYKYVDSNCFLSKNIQGLTNVMCLYPSGAFLNDVFIPYEKIKSVNVSNFMFDQQKLEIGIQGEYLLKIYTEVKQEDTQFEKVNKILVERASDMRKGNVSTSKKGCYVATCVYGSYDCPEVWTLRRYRDDTLGSTWYGRAFIRTYYAISPTLVKWFGKTKWFKKMWKGKLDRMVKNLQEKGVENTPYEDKEW